MSWSRHGGGGDEGGGKRRGYHHGNLREALVDAALELIGRRGAAGLTIAEAARLAGVSPAAPYRHFKDRDALLADVARRGFERFETALRAAWNDGRPDPARALHSIGRAYLAFARDNPAYYSAMFESGLASDASVEFRAAGERAFGLLRGAVEVLIAELPEGRRPPAMMVALHIWALTHGIASLFGRGDAARRPVPMSPDDLLEAAVLVYLDGLGLRRP